MHEQDGTHNDMDELMNVSCGTRKMSPPRKKRQRHLQSLVTMLPLGDATFDPGQPVRCRASWYGPEEDAHVNDEAQSKRDVAAPVVENVRHCVDNSTSPLEERYLLTVIDAVIV